MVIPGAGALVIGRGRERIAEATARLARLAFAIVVVLSPFRLREVLDERSIGGLFHDYTDIRIGASELALVVLLGLWMASRLARPRPLETGPGWLRWSGLLLLGASWLGVPGSVDPALSAANAAALTAYAGLALYVRNEVRGPRELVVPVIAMLGLQATVGIGQVLLQRSVGLSGLGELLIGPGIPGSSIVTTLDGVRLLRAYGLTDHSNVLGGVLVFGLCILASMLDRSTGATGRGAAPEPRRLTIASLGAAGLALVATALAFSRGAWLALAVGGATGVAISIAARRPEGARRWLVAIGASALVGLALVIPYGSAFAARVDPSPVRPASEIRSIDERLALADAAVQVAAAHPLLGTGIGTLPEAMAVAVPDLRYPPQPAHVVLLTAFAETGVVGALGMAGLLFGPWMELRRRSASATTGRAPAAALLAAIVVVGLFDYYPWAFAAGRTWTAIGVGLWAAVAAPTPEPV
jgi:hypothetical protein